MYVVVCVCVCVLAGSHLFFIVCKLSTFYLCLLSQLVYLSLMRFEDYAAADGDDHNDDEDDEALSLLLQLLLTKVFYVNLFHPLGSFSLSCVLNRLYPAVVIDTFSCLAY